MKTLKRNKRTFYYATYNGKTEILDASGNHTFEYENSYSEWKPFSAHVSPARGVSSAELFGNDISYDKTIVTDDTGCEIDENTILCIDIAPNEEGQPLVYDYIVTKKAVSINFVQYAVSKVKVNG